MVIKTELTAGDFQAFSRYISLGRNGILWVYTALIGAGLVVGIITGVALAFARVPLNMPCFMAGLLSGVCWLVIFSKLQARRMRPAPDGSILGSRTISVTAEGIREASPNQEALIRWPAVRAVESVGEHIFIMVDRNAGIIVPRRSFASDQERDQFLEEIRQHSPSGKP